MKDLPHHMKKLNRRVIRSSLREPEEELPENMPGLPPFQKSEEEKRKIEKREMRDLTTSRTPIHDTPDERNRKMKRRVPVFDRNNAVPKRARPTKKKTPRI
jgi:hypothetical protein